MTTGAYIVTYTGLTNNDYDGTQLVFHMDSKEDAEFCVWDMLEAMDWDGDAFKIQAQELSIEELEVLALVGDDPRALKYLQALKMVEV